MLTYRCSEIFNYSEKRFAELYVGNEMKKKLITSGIVALACCALLVTSLTYRYAKRFPSLLEQQASVIAHGRHYCIVVQPYPEINQLTTLDSFSEVSLIDIVKHRLSWSEYTYQRDYIGFAFHVGIICDNKGYFWSFREGRFIQNS